MSVSKSSKAVILGLVLVLGLVTVGGVGAASFKTRPLPEFTGSASTDWINSEPLSVSDLQGRVVLVDVWTFECWNCYRSFPWLNELEARLADANFQVIGIHSPEFERERDRAAVARKVREFELDHPVMIDNDFSYWRALNNRYWPTFYLVDKRGQIRARYIGETHAGSRQAKAIEQRITELLAEDSTARSIR